MITLITRLILLVIPLRPTLRLSEGAQKVSAVNSSTSAEGIHAREGKRMIESRPGRLCRRHHKA